MMMHDACMMNTLYIVLPLYIQMPLQRRHASSGAAFASYKNASSWEVELAPPPSADATSSSSSKGGYRGIIQLTGPDACKLLQGLITNDVIHLKAKVEEHNSVAAAFLTAKGRDP